MSRRDEGFELMATWRSAAVILLAGSMAFGACSPPDGDGVQVADDDGGSRSASTDSTPTTATALESATMDVTSSSGITYRYALSLTRDYTVEDPASAVGSACPAEYLPEPGTRYLFLTVSVSNVSERPTSELSGKVLVHTPNGLMNPYQNTVTSELGASASSGPECVPSEVTPRPSMNEVPSLIPMGGSDVAPGELPAVATMTGDIIVWLTPNLEADAVVLEAYEDGPRGREAIDSVEIQLP